MNGRGGGGFADFVNQVVLVVFLAFWSLQGPADPWCFGVNGLELVSSSHVARTELSEAPTSQAAVFREARVRCADLFRPLAGPKTKA